MDQEINNMILGKQKAELVFKNTTYFNVFSKEWETSDIAIAQGKIIGLGKYNGDVEKEINGYLIPGLIDTHVHIESSFMMPQDFSKVIIKNGVTTVIADPHEIANVSGTAGIKMMIENAKHAHANIKFMIPSCVPATEFESSGAVLGSETIKPLYLEKSVIGLAEVMNFPAVIRREKDIMEKINFALRNNKIVDGHIPGVTGKELNSYICAGVMTDHESFTLDEAKEKMQKGMQVLIREGTAAKNLEAIIPLVNDKNVSSFCFCTDDRHITDLIKEGSINYLIKKAVNLGCSLENCLIMATINAAKTYNLNDCGAIAPGRRADFAILDSLSELNVVQTYVSGQLIEDLDIIQSPMLKTNNLNTTPRIDLTYPISPKIKYAIEIIPNQIITKACKINLSPIDNFESMIDPEYVKLCVIERHHAKDEIGIGLVKNFPIKSGAIATTVSHDSHNLIVIGTNDKDMQLAISECKKINGGYVVVGNDNVLARLPLEIGGLMTSKPTPELLKLDEQLQYSLTQIGFSGNFNPFLTLSFIALPVIPSLKLTSKGMYHIEKQKFVNK
jgi:adenine deaminase